MRIVLTGGGSAGHVTPLLAVAAELKRANPDCQLVYVGQFGDRRFDSLLRATNDLHSKLYICAGKWRRYHGAGWWAHLRDWKTLLKNARDLVLFGLGFIQSVAMFVVKRPNLVFVKGGYVGLPVGLAAALLRIPIVTHDSDALPGLTNRILGRFARVSAVGMSKEAYTQYARVKVVETGNPVRKSFFELPDADVCKRSLHITTPLAVLVFGGSLGAQRLNRAVLKGLDTLLARTDVTLLWISGEVDEVYVRNATAKHPEARRVIVKPFTHELAEYIGACDVVVSRAGASSIAELAAAAKPSIFVPNPLLTGGHQVKNAHLLAQKKAAIVIAEHDADEQLMLQVVDLLDNESKRLELSKHIAGLAHPEAAKQLADVLLQEAS